MNLEFFQQIPPGLATDLVSSILAGTGCLLVVLWILRAPTSSFLERRSIPILVTLSAVYLLRIYGWLDEFDSFARWLAFWPATLHPLVMALLVEGLLRRHLPLWLKWTALLMTAYFLVVQVLPSPTRETLLFYPWPIGVVLMMALLARHMWVMRDAGLSREERQTLAAVTAVAIIGIPLVFTDGRGMTPMLPNRLGAIAGLLLAWVLVGQASVHGLRETLVGIVRHVWRAAVLTTAVVLALLPHTPEYALLAFTVSLSALLLFAILDRLRRRRRDEGDVQLLHWLATAPRGSLQEWRRALRHAPLLGDALILEGPTLAKYDAARLRSVMRAHDELVTEPALRAELPSLSGDPLLATEEMLDLVHRYDLTHVGLLTEEPLRLVGANVPGLAGRDAMLQMQVLLRTGQEAVARDATERLARA